MSVNYPIAVTDKAPEKKKGNKFSLLPFAFKSSAILIAENRVNTHIYIYIYIYIYICVLRGKRSKSTLESSPSTKAAQHEALFLQLAHDHIQRIPKGDAAAHLREDLFCFRG